MYWACPGGEYWEADAVRVVDAAAANVGLAPPFVAAGLAGSDVLLDHSLTAVDTEDLEAGCSSPIYIVLLIGSIHIVSVNPAQFGPSSIVQVVMAGWPGNRIESFQNAQVS